VPRTLDGKPDLQGIWSHTILTPLERPGGLNKTEYTEEEAAELEQQDQQQRIEARIAATVTPEGEKTTDAYNTFWREGYFKKIPQTVLRTSQIVDPADGFLPPLIPAAKQRLAETRERGSRPAKGPEDRPMWTRCIRGGESGPPIIGTQNYNSNLQIVQSPSHVVILQEMIHEAQIVPLDGRPHLSQQVGLWKGNARGRWEGDTLVIESTNFRPGSLATRFFSQGTTEKMHLVERYRLLDKDSLFYSFTIEDPGTWTRPWTAEYVMWRRDDSALVEYACHEGNRGFEGQLTGARAVDP
jgi:hypothetical protein